MAVKRIQKILSERGVTSRRKAEELISRGKVKVNGHPAKLGDKADDTRDTITVAGKQVGKAETPRYIMLHKPRGYVTTLSDERGRKCVAELVEDVGTRLFPVGRLDRESEGLLIMTNDGDFANAVIHPASHLDKHYRVTVRAAVTDDQLMAIREGMMLEDRRTAPADAHILTSEPNRTVMEIVLYEGRNRQIRKMCEMLNLEVMRLRRTAIADVKLGMLPAGKWRDLQPNEVKKLVAATQTTKKVAATYIKHGKEVLYNARHSSGRS